MKAMVFLFAGFLVLAGCDGTDDSTASTGPRTCGPATAPGGIQPDKASIENLFGCVTLTYVRENGGEVVAKSVVFSASSEREPILGGRTVGATEGFTNYLCTEVSFGAMDFLCVSSFINTLNRYELNMDSQFNGSGTHQLCLGSLDNCNLDGAEFPIQAATIEIARGAEIVRRASLTTSASERTATSFHIDVPRLDKTVTIADVEKKLVYQELLAALRRDQNP